MKATVAIALFLSSVSHLSGQDRLMDRNGKASFFSSAPMEDIEAHNNQAVSVLDLKTGEVVASMLMRSFDFRKAMMEEHFNESYVESHKFPKASFKGTVRNIDQLDLSKEGKYVLDIEGEISLHGVTRPLAVQAEAVVTNGSLRAKTTFSLKVDDFKIEIPKLVINNIAEEVEVTVAFDYKPMTP